MRYVSTRGTAPALDFESAVLAGLASDGGLYVPESVPQISAAQWTAWQALSYHELALEIIALYVGDSVPRADLKRLIDESYASFRHDAVVPLKQTESNEWVLELFHGPTLAFKDVALQFLGRLMDYFLTRQNQTALVLGATSGDTGSAALAGCRGSARMQSFILFPHGRVSDVQRRQMTTLPDANIHTIALRGTFDDCQDIVKHLFADAAFRSQHKLVAVNSINWARILAQVVYYAYAALRLSAPARAISFSVPTGNFGDIFAGYIASQMGIPVHTLIIATNHNDILARCVASGRYAMEGVKPSHSPSMDIQISSNFERLLFDLYDRDAAAIAALMHTFRAEKSITLTPSAHAKLKALFASKRVNDDETLATIAALHRSTGEVVDPHTAVGFKAGRDCHTDAATPLVVLATAHPAKFPDAVKAACGIHPALPAGMDNLFDLPERFEVLDNSIEAIKSFMEQHRQ